MKKESLPSISIVITTYNAAHLLDRCLASVASQDYPKAKLEIVLVDDRSEDNTVEVAREYTKKIYYSGKRFCEISRAIGIKKAKNELIFLLDADNVLPNEKFLIKAATPFLKEKDLVGSFPARFYYDPKDPLANRYCSLFGLNDPLQFYSQAREHLSYFEDSWTLLGKAADKGDYYLVTFPKDSLLTLGAIGFLGKKSLMKKEINNGFFFHSDAFNHLINQGKNKFAVTKQTIIHQHCDSTKHFFQKLARNFDNYLKYKDKRGKNWATGDKLRFLMSVIVMSTFLVPLKDSVRGFTKKPDFAWFYHPIYSFSAIVIYTYMLFKNLFLKRNHE
jgi:glycosyltransferase involved in cell wall biosynthesis